MTKTLLMTARIKPANQGFGEYEMGEPCGFPATAPKTEWDDPQDAIAQWVSESADAGVDLEPTNEIDDRVYDAAGDIYKGTFLDGHVCYYAAWAAQAAQAKGANA